MFRPRPSAALCLATALAVAGVARGQAPLAVSDAAGLRPVTVAGLHRLPAADLVLLDGGYAAGWRSSLLGAVERDGAPVGTVLVAEVRPDRAAAAILRLEPGQAIRPGDRVLPVTLFPAR